jgi:hypothetical protein
MDAMFNLRAKAAPPANGRSLKRLEFEMALELADTGDRPHPELIRQAAATAGADLLFVLPAPDGSGVTSVVRLAENGGDRLLQIRTADDGFAICEEAEMDAETLSFARASIDVLERLKADGQILEPLAAASH